MPTHTERTRLLVPTEILYGDDLMGGRDFGAEPY